MADVRVVSQNASRIVLEAGEPPVTERWTVSVAAIAADPGLLAQVRDEMIVYIEAKQAAWEAAQAAVASL